MGQPLISIVTPVYNARLFIYDYVSSIKSQTYTKWECILVDDSSSDNSLALLHSLTHDDSRFRLYSNTVIPDLRSPASARNLALSQCNGDLIAFCDIDDLWHPEKLELQANFHIQNRLDISVTSYLCFFSSVSRKDHFRIVQPPARTPSPSTLFYNPIPMLTVLVRKSCLTTVFREVRHEDFLFWLTIFSYNPNIRYGTLPIPLSFYRIHSSNISSNKLMMPLWTFSVFRKNGSSRLRSTYLLIRWIFHHLQHTLFRLLPYSRTTKYSVSDLLVMPPLR